MNRLLLSVLTLFVSLLTFAQENDHPIIAPHSQDEVVRIVIRTEEKVNDQFIAIDNLTIKVSGDTSKVYYMNYGDGIVSSMMIPFPVFKKYIAFEEAVSGYECLSKDCKYSILIEIGEERRRYVIDILHLEAVSSLMLELEN